MCMEEDNNRHEPEWDGWLHQNAGWIVLGVGFAVCMGILIDAAMKSQ